VVFFGVTDPVKVGIVQSLARPGGNVTGLTLTTTYEYYAKQLELLKAVVPSLRRLGIISDIQEDRPNWQPILEQAGTTLGVDVLPPTMVRRREEFQNAIEKLVALKAGGVLVTMASATYVYRAELSEKLARARVPSIGIVRELPEAGGLMSYGTDLRAIFTRLADYVDRILRGAKPADLPVEQPTKFELVVNLKTARALGLTVPKSLLVRADHVID
jgi:putative ABC transport system substrate-binding protein